MNAMCPDAEEVAPAAHTELSALRVTWPVMADTRNCAQCGTLFVPRREHARFCSARCRVAWNRQHVSGPPASGALDWSVTAMRETTGRLLRANGWDRPTASP